jgi:hypothetical protein
MQLNDLQELVCKLKQNNDMQVETTTLGKFLGVKSDKVAIVLGRDILKRPVIVSTRRDQIQLLDLKSGFVISFTNAEELLPKLVKTFSNGVEARPRMVSSVVKTEMDYKEVIKRQAPQNGGLSCELSEYRDVMYKSGSLDDRIALVKKTINVLEKHKDECENGELERVEKAQTKLHKIVEHANTHRLAPGQLPSVYEIAIWSWVN